ncbi:MAG: fluoride efflux transporter CrcB, partial [Muribaculaceae bacterium]|nr:fluoride efflux transporter CrcB [Muribaculaceae bacterium]
FKATMIAGAGGFIGSCMRFLSGWLGNIVSHGAFPLGTFMANILGCLLIGIFYGWATKRHRLTENHKLFLITGLCGGFTTFSTFSDEMVSLIESGNISMFVFYLAISLVAGLLAVLAGIAMVRPNKTKTAKAAGLNGTKVN